MSDMNSILPLLLLSDDDSNSTLDMTSFFLYSSMLQNDCEIATDDQFGAMLPLLLMDSEDGNSDNLMLMLMMQTMGDSPVGMDNIFPLLFLLDDEGNSTDSVLLMVLLNSMTGGMNSQQGFDNNFNMMLPLLLLDGEDNDDSQSDMLVLMMAMQSQAPGSAFGTDMMLPLLLMDDSGDNETLLFFMMMNQGKTKCEPAYVPAPEPVVVVQPDPQVETVFRTWRVNADGTRELIEESVDTA